MKIRPKLAPSASSAALMIAAVLVFLAGVPASAGAQFSGLAKRVAREVKAPRVATETNGTTESTPAEEQTNTTGAGGPSAEEDPWAPLPAKGRISRPGELSFPSSVAEAKRALDRFGAHRCSGCEGGFGYDSWVRHGANLLGDYKLEDLVGGYAVGETLRWKGVVARGELTVIDNRPIHGFPCKQVRYTLYKDDEQASRPGLFCLGKPSPYSSTDRWVEVF